SPLSRYAHFVAQYTPHATAVYASWPASPPGSRNTRFQAARYALPGLDFHQLIAPASWRTSIRATDHPSSRIASMQQPFDRAAEDLGNSIHSEHVNVTIPD